MQTIPNDILERYLVILKKRAVPVSHEEGTRWGARFNEWRCLERTASPDWDKLIHGLAAEIKTRHYSRKTLKTYADWVRKFQRYLRNKPPDALSASDVKAYLTYLAVNGKVSTTRSQRRPDNNDLYPLRTEQNHQRGGQPAGLLI